MVDVVGRSKYLFCVTVIYWMWYSLLMQGRCLKFFDPFRNSASVSTFFHTSSVTLCTSWGKKNHHGRREDYKLDQLDKWIFEFRQLCSTLRWMPKLIPTQRQFYHFSSSFTPQDVKNVSTCYWECNFFTVFRRLINQHL